MSNAFKGDFKVTTQNILGKMEMKRLRASLMDEFPNLTKKMLGKVLPKNEESELPWVKTVGVCGKGQSDGTRPDHLGAVGWHSG